MKIYSCVILAITANSESIFNLKSEISIIPVICPGIDERDAIERTRERVDKKYMDGNYSVVIVAHEQDKEALQRLLTDVNLENGESENQTSDLVN